MISSFITSFKLKNTYRVNSIIYSIKQLPLIKKILPNSLYKSKGLKIFGNIISTLIEIGGIFIGKYFYLIFMIMMECSLYKTNLSDTFLHIFTCLTICGGLFNTYMFNPTKDKYYAMMLMNMDAKKYTLSNYFYMLLKVIIGFLPFTIIFGLESKVPLIICILLPIFVVMVKMTISNFCLVNFEKTKKATNENLPPKYIWILSAILLGIAYGLPFLGFVINKWIFIIIFILFLITGIFSFYKIVHFNSYKKMYRQILTNENIYAIEKSSSTEVLKESVSKQIEFDSNFTSNKTGFAYFHDLFVKRHRKILTKAVKKQTSIASLIFAVVIAFLIINPKVAKEFNEIPLTYLPYFVFVMYLLNRGTSYTQAMFMNCDHSMLTYRIYRTPRVILGLFKERLKTLIYLNLLPASVISIGLPIILFLSGGTTNPLNYLVLFISIIAMSIFFSVHYLVMYYLLQPYNVSTEMKSSTYRVMQMITYFICYYMIQVQLPTIYFGLATIIFSVSYSLISLFIVYRHAPKTFKLRI